MNITIHGKPFEVEPEPADFWGWIAEGRYDYEWRLFDRFLKPEHTFIDLGAWVGSHSLYASTLAKHILAVEPDSVALPILQANTAAVPKIEVLPIAITDHDGTLTIGSSWLGASTTRANNVAGTCAPWAEGHIIDVPCMTLRQLCSPYPDPLFIKMDVEGSEEQILRDFEFFEERKPVLYLSTHTFWWRDVDATAAAIRRIGNLYKHVFQANNLEPVILDHGVSRDYIFTNKD